MKKHLLLSLMTLLPMLASAYDAEIDGIYYNFSGDEAIVTYQNYQNNTYISDYSGSIVIPEAVIYNGTICSVTSIGVNAFRSCSGLTSIIIPNSVTRIGSDAFENCSGLTSVTIPGSVTSIGRYAFYYCSSLTSVTIPDGVTNIGDRAFEGCTSLTSITIPEGVTSIGDRAFEGCTSLTSVTIPGSVTSIGESAFSGCSSLTSITIPESVTSIGDYAFDGCSGLTSITIPNSVTSIGSYAFGYCSGLTSITIPNSVTSIGSSAFYGCSGLTSITIPNSVTSIGSYAFGYCSGLTSITIPNSVTSIGDRAFYGCDIFEVISKIENPFNIGTNTFSDNTFYNATLYVPTGTIEKYKATEGWKKFVFFEEIKGEQCATPTISYENGKLTFNCETEGATCQYTIADTDIKSGSGDEVQLSVTYTISVYAKKAGYENSETATGTLCWIDQQPDAESIVAEDAVHEVKALPVLIQTHGGTISVQGLDAGTEVFVYTTDGKQQGSNVVVNGATTIHTSLHPGSVAIVKIGERSIKVLVK